MPTREELVAGDEGNMKSAGGWSPQAYKTWMAAPSTARPQRAATLMLLWRICHIQNKITHQKPAQSVEGSRRFLPSYMTSLILIRQFLTADVTKRKMVISHDQGFQSDIRMITSCQNICLKWTPPDTWMVKLDLDGAFGRDGERAWNGTMRPWGSCNLRCILLAPKL
jgi:hypothetical protein